MRPQVAMSEAIEGKEFSEMYTENNVKQTNHILHAILTLIFLPWALIWIGVALTNKQHNEVGK